VAVGALALTVISPFGVRGPAGPAGRFGLTPEYFLSDADPNSTYLCLGTFTLRLHLPHFSAMLLLSCIETVLIVSAILLLIRLNRRKNHERVA